MTSSRWGEWPGSFRVEAATGNFLEPLPSYRFLIGKTLYARVVGAATSVCYGTDVYSDDSDLATAAVHAGLVREGEDALVRITILGAQRSLQGSLRNGVSSYAYGQWPGSFRLERVPLPAADAAPAASP